MNRKITKSSIRTKYDKNHFVKYTLPVVFTSLVLCFNINANTIDTSKAKREKETSENSNYSYTYNTATSLESTINSKSFFNVFTNYFNSLTNTKEVSVTTKVSSKYECAPIATLANTIRPISNGYWFQAKIWPNGKLPTIQDNVIIPRGMKVTMAGIINARTIIVRGRFNAINWQTKGAWIKMQTKAIMVESGGAFEIGTTQKPYLADCAITLIGRNPNETITNSMGAKFIGVMSGGSLEIHGKQKLSWSKIGSQANTGATSLRLAKKINWEVGDKVVITPNRLNPNEVETRIITKITTDNRIHFKNGLRYPRMGTRKRHQSAKSGRSWFVDTRAEVGHLSRNITIQSDAYSENSKTGFGGHIMAMNNSTANASNVELFRMGQKAKLGRYPWHWHLMGDSSKGLSLRNSSIHRSYNRAIVIHGSHGTIVDNNVAYDHVGHGIILEDGSERLNTISNNLALMTRRPKSGEELTKSDIDPIDDDQNSAPATYWITNPHNSFIRNVAAGTIGTGFWFAFPKKPTGASADDPRFRNIEPFKENLRRFDGNIVHSSRNGFDVNDQLDAQHAIVTNGPWKNPRQAIINNMTVFSCRLAFYSGIGDDNENLVLNNCVSADNVLHTRFASNTIIQNSIFVANTGLLSNQIKKEFYRVYDGPGRVYNSHMVGWNTGNVSFFNNKGAAQKRGNHLFKGISFNHSGPPKVVTSEVLPTCSQGKSGQVWGTILYDIDGSLTGKSNSSIIPDLDFNKTLRTYKVPNWNGMMGSTQRYVYVRFGHNPNFEITRFNKGVKQASFNYIKAKIGGVNQTHIPVDHSMYEHQIAFPDFPTNVRNLPIWVNDAIRAGDAVTLRLKGWSTLPGVQISNARKVNSLQQLRAQEQSSYFLRNNGDLYLRIITKANSSSFSQNFYNVTWRNSAGISHAISSNDCNASKKIAQRLANTDETAFNLKIHPNPATSLTTISMSGDYNNATLSVYNILGKKVTSSLPVSPQQSSIKIDISDLPTGLYWIRVVTDSGLQKSIRLAKK